MSTSCTGLWIPASVGRGGPTSTGCGRGHAVKPCSTTTNATPILHRICHPLELWSGLLAPRLAVANDVHLDLVDFPVGAFDLGVLVRPAGAAPERRQGEIAFDLQQHRHPPRPHLARRLSRAATTVKASGTHRGTRRSGC